MPDMPEDRGAAVAEVLRSRGNKKVMRVDEGEAPGELKGGMFMVDAGLFPSLANKKVGDVVYLTVKINKITGRMMEVSPYQDEGEESPVGEGVVEPAAPGEGGEEGVQY